MTAIRLADFGGMLPVRSPRLLPANMATVAENAYLRSGMLRGIRKPRFLAHAPTQWSSPERVWRLRNLRPDPVVGDREVWVQSLYRDAEIVRSPITNDTLDRWYLFEPDSAPKVNTFDRLYGGEDYYALAITAPTTALVANPSNVSGETEVRVYTYTYVTEWGEETLPGPTTTVTVTENESVTLSGAAFTPVDATEGRAIEFVRIYRTVTGQASNSFFFVADVALADLQLVDAAKNEIVVLNSVLDTWSYDPPPEGLRGVRRHPSGALVAFLGREVYFSAPYRPHAWPETWKVSVQHEIVGLEVWNQNVIVLTTANPVMLYGSSPETIGSLSYPHVEPCVAYRSIVGTEQGVLYASPAGLVLVTANGPQRITDDIIGEGLWSTEYVSDDIVAVEHNGTYLATTNGGSGFVIDPSGGKSLVTTFANVGIDLLAPDLYSDAVFAVRGDNIYLWDDDVQPELEYRWRSGELFQTKPVNFSALTVHHENVVEGYRPVGRGYVASDQVLVRVWADGDLVFEAGVGNREICRLPSGFRADVWQIEIMGYRPVHALALAETVRELSQL